MKAPLFSLILPRCCRFPALGMAAGIFLLLAQPQSGQILPRFQQLPERVAGGHWRLTWTTESGAQYRLERSLDLANWFPVTTLTAGAETTSFTDIAVPAGAETVFWRAVRLGGLDTQPPVVSILQVRRIADSGLPSLELTVQAQDNIGVVAVNYVQGAVQLGAAGEGPVGTWKKIVPVDLNDPNPRQFQARAADAAGNTGFSDIYTYVPQIQSADLQPLDSTGVPAADALVGQKPDGSLNPFTYLPGLTGGGSSSHGLRLDFPDGGNLVTENGLSFFEARRVRIGFGPASPTQFILPDGSAAGFIERTAPTGQTLRVPRGDMSYQAMAGLLGVDPAAGIALQVHGKSEMLWKGGDLTRSGIRGGTYQLTRPALTLPGTLGGYDREVVDLSSPGPVGMAVHGSMRLGKLARLEIPRARPLSLQILPGGEITLTGIADLVFDDGARFSVEVFLDDPVYRLALRAGNLEVPLMSSLSDLLPDDPESCIPGGFDKVALDHAATCLEAHQRAYRFFIAASRGLRPDSPGDATVQTVPGVVDLTGAAAEAWATLKAAELTASVPLQPLQEAIDSLSRQARGGGSTPVETLEVVLRLETLRRNLALAGNPTLLAKATAALQEARPALLRSLEDPAVLSREALARIVAVLASDEFAMDPELSAAAGKLLERAVVREAGAIGVVAGVTAPAANAVLQATNPYQAREVLRRLALIEEVAQQAGLSVLDLPLFNECFQQVFAHGYAVTLDSIDRAIAARNPLGCMLFFAELVDLQALEQLSAVEILASPAPASITARLTGVSALLEQSVGLSPSPDPNDPVTREQVFAFSQQFRSVMEIAARLPAGDSTVQGIASIVFTRLESLLPVAVSSIALAGLEDEQDLLLLLDAGILHGTLKRRYPAFASAFNWEGPPVGDVAARLVGIATTVGDSALLERVINRLLEEAEVLEQQAQANAALAGVRRESRKRYLVVASETLAALHPMAIIEWDAAESRRGQNPDQFSADGFLPGDLKIDRLAGAVQYNRLNGRTEGRFSGSLRLPKLDSALTIHRASIDSDGRFDLSASGALRLPGTPDAPIVSLTVPRSQPMHVALQPGRPPLIEGRARLDFDNGSFVGVGLRFADPIYTFQAEAGGIQTGLRDALLAVNSPQLGSLNLSPLWADYYEGFGTWLEGFEGTDEPEGPPAADDFPDFEEQQPGDVATLLDAWLSRALADAQLGSDAFLQSSSGIFTTVLDFYSKGIGELLVSFDNLFPPSPEQRAEDVLKRLNELTALQKKLGELFDALAEANLDGGGFDLSGVQAFFAQADALVARAIQTVDSDPELLKRPELVRTITKAAVDQAAARQLAGEDSSVELAAAVGFLRRGMEAYLTSRGLNANGTVTPAILNALDASGVEETFREFFNFHTDLMTGGDEGGLPDSHLRDMARALADKTLVESNFDPVTGLIDDSAPDEELLARIRRLHAAYLKISLNLNTPFTPPANLTFASFLLHKELVERSKRLPEDQWYQRFQLLAGARSCRDLRLAAGGSLLTDVELNAEELRMLNGFARQGTGRLRKEEVELLRDVKGRRNVPPLEGIYRSRLLEAANTLFAALASPWPAAKLPLGRILAAEITVLDELAGASLVFPAGRSPDALLARVRQRVEEVSAAARKAKPAASIARATLISSEVPTETLQIRNLLGAGNVAIRDTIDPDTVPAEQTPAFKTALKTESAALLNASRAVIADRAGDARPPAGPDFSLPGDLEIDRVFGGFFFNRSTGFFRGTFGGKLRFPDPRATFEITQATFDSTGAFSITAATGLPVKVMDNDRATLNATLAVAGSPAGLQSVSGTGQLTVPFGPDQPGVPGTRTYQGSFAYDPAAPGKPLSFSAAVDGVQNEFKLGNDFALYEANLALTFSTIRPDVTLQIGGKAGFFARPGAPAALGPDGKFWVVCDIDSLEMAFSPQTVSATFEGGELKLASDLFQSDLPGSGPVRFGFNGRLGMNYSFATGLPSFFGNDNPADPFVVSGGNFRFKVPGINDSLIVVEDCSLQLFQSRFPVLANLDANFRFPLPGLNAADPAQRVPEFALNVQGWGVDGFIPQGVSVTLTNGLSLIDLDGFGVELLGQGAGGFPPVSLGFKKITDGGQTFTRMELEGGMRVSIANSLITPKIGTTPQSSDPLTTTNGAMRATVAGDFGWTFRSGSLPEVSLEEIVIEGQFLLGGTLEIGGVNRPLASLRVRGFEDLFTRANPADPFSIELTASIGVPDLGAFELEEAKFIWNNPNSGIPQFSVKSVGAVLGNSLSTLLGEGLPIYLKELSLGFEEADRPLIGSPGNPGRFDLDNIIITVTAEAGFPPSAPGAPPASGPRFGGEIRNLQVRFPTGNLLAPDFQLDGVVMGIDGLDIPPLSGIKGQVALLNLDQLRLDPPRFDRVTFAGELGASFNGPGVSVLLAASPLQVHGAAISVDAGVAGIPLDGGTLGGILWTGASGGIHFKNSFEDPTEFSTYLQRDGDGTFTGADEFPPAGDPGENPGNLEDPLEEVEIASGEDNIYVKPDLPQTGGNFDPFDCLKDNWPPRAANPLLEEFPANSGRLVFKGSRLTSAEANAFLNSIGVVNGDTRTAEQIITAFINRMTADIRTVGGQAVNGLLAASGVAGNQAIVTHYNDLTEKLIQSFDDVARPILRGILQPVGLAGGAPVRDQMHALLLNGIPGFNVTFLGSGTFTHAAVAPVMDVKGTVSVSTTGAALARGELRMIGIPVAEASVGMSLTNEAGDISPFMGGLARVGIGPIELGKLTMSASLPDAASVVTHFNTYVSCTAGALTGAAESRLRFLAETIAKTEIPAGVTLQAFLLARSDAEKLALTGALFDFIARSVEGSLPSHLALAQADLNSLVNCFAVFVSNSLNALTPEICFGGKIQPSLFDIPMTTSGMPLASARMRYGPVLRPALGGESRIALLGDAESNYAAGGLPGLREFSAYAQFSPTALLLSPIPTGTFVALNPTNAAFVGFTAIDSAEFGFSFQVEEWTPEKVKLFLFNPPQYFAGRTEEFFNTAVFAAGYQMSPFGMKLADGQLRMVFPDTNLHPRRPGGVNASRLNNPIKPFNASGARILPLPSTDEVILAALTAGKIQDATFRGNLGQLDDLFPVPGPTPSADGNVAKVERIAASLRALDPSLTQLSGKSFARDYFPYGGLIGGGQLAMPKILTQGLPPRWNELFTDSGAEWLDAFSSVIEFLGSTDSVGQLAYYIPAPNPVLFPGENATDVWSNLTIDGLLRRLQMDPAALIGRSINPNLYEVNEIALAGWAKANLLGVELGEAQLSYNGAARRLEALAQISPNVANDGNWFNDFFSGSARFALQLPRDQQAGLVTYGTEQLFAHINSQLNSIRNLSGASLNAKVAEIQQSLAGALPRVSLEIATGVQIPPPFANVLRTTAGLKVFGFSPYFDPEFEPQNFSPVAVARRRGGLGLQGAFDFGYFPPTGAPVVISVPDVSLALTPPVGAGLPAITGQVIVDDFAIPGAPSFRDGLLQFASGPGNGAPFIAVQGTIEPFVFRLPTPLGPVDLLRAQSLNPGQDLSASFRIIRQDGAPGGAGLSLSISPVAASMPFLGQDVAVAMHGAPLPGGGLGPFSFSTGAGQPWSAQLALSDPGNPAAPPTFSIRDPFSPLASEILMSFTPSGPVTGGIAGQGLDSFNAEFTVPAGFEIVFYPGRVHEMRVNIPAGRNFVFAFDSTGRFYCNLGSLTNIRLPGFIEAGATVEFGFNTTDPQPDVRLLSGGAPFAGPLAFGSINLVDSVTQSFVVRNQGSLAANVSLNIHQGSSLPDFTLGTQGFQLEPGGERTVRVVCRPKAAGARSAVLRVTSEDPDSPVQSISLTATGLAQPRFFASRPSVDFGDSLVGATTVTTLTIGNSGSANLSFTPNAITGAGFALSPAGAVTLAPGTERVYTLTFSPASLGTVTGSLTFNVTAPAVASPVPLTGNGSETRWVEVLNAATAGRGDQLNAIKMLDARRGYIAGNGGTFLETLDGGRSWTPRDITKRNLRAFAFDNADAPANAAAALYHFDDTPGTPAWLDSSGNNRHGAPPAAPATPLTSFSSGKFGSGLRLDGVDDYAELAVFPIATSFTVSVWVNPTSPGTDGQALWANTTNAGSDRLVLGFYNGGYELRFRDPAIGAQAPLQISALRVSGWQHFVVTGLYDSVANTTLVRLFRNGTQLGSKTFTGAGATSISQPWVLGQQWDFPGSVLTPADFFRGEIDEFQVYDGVLGNAAIAALRDNNGSRLVVAGDGGRVFQTFGNSGLWAQHPDLNAFGWRNQTRTFQTVNWHAASLFNGKLLLGGNRVLNPFPQTFTRMLMQEDGAIGEDGTAGSTDDEFAEAAVTGGPVALNPRITGLTGGEINLPRAIDSAGGFYLQDTASGATPRPFVANSSVTGSLNAITQYNFFNQIVAVGAGGNILRATGGAASLLPAVTTANLNAVAFAADVSPSMHVVGDNGTWLTSPNAGNSSIANSAVNWTLSSDRPSGRLTGVEVKRDLAGAATDYHVWTVGDSHSVHLRPSLAPSGPFMTFYPGKLDFGFLTLGETKTLEVSLTNRGRQNLAVTSLTLTGPAAARFVRAQTSYPNLRPGETGRIAVRYAPAGTASSMDYAELVVATNDAGQSFRIPLEGRAAGNEWQPVALTNAGVAVDGVVEKVSFTSITRGYALVSPASGDSVFYRTNDGGQTWTRSTFGSFGGVLKLVSMDFNRPSGAASDVGLVCGHVADANGVFIKGLVLRTIVSHTSNLVPAWTDQTPLASGQTTQPLRVADVSITSSFLGSNTGNLRCVAATTGNSSQSNVFDSSNSGGIWTLPADRPSSFNGGPVGVAATTVFIPMLAVSGNGVHFRPHGGTWGTTSQQVQGGAALRDLQFIASSVIGADFSQGWAVGDDGTLLVWDPNFEGAGDWFPPLDAEVFGTTDLKGVNSADLRNVWIVGESRIFRSTDEGVTWDLSFDAGVAAEMKAVASRSGSEAWAGGALAGRATIWRYVAPAPPVPPVLQIASLVDVGNVTAGSIPTRTVTITNNGSSALALHDLSIEAEEPLTRFRITGTPPVSVAAGTSANVSFVFEASPEPALAADLAPAFFHRFEQEWDASRYTDDSANARLANAAQFAHGPAVLPANQPRLVTTGLRDRCLRFDGNDILEVNGFGSGTGPDKFGDAAYALSLWVFADGTGGTQVMLAKDTATGGDLFKFALTAAGHQVSVRGNTVSGGGVPVTGVWQHVVANCTEADGSTTVQLYRDGEQIDELKLTGILLGDAAGRPWTMGADWTSASAFGSGFTGCLDDVAVFDRALTPGEIQQLASKSPLYGLHEAELVIRSGSQGGERRVGLRANVAPAAEFITFRTEPEGLPVEIDGIEYVTPVSFAVVPTAGTAPTAREWVEGSRHRITATPNEILPDAQGSVRYDFSEWSAGGSREFFLTAARRGVTYTATYAPKVIVSPAVGNPPPRVPGATLAAGLAGAPKGPFLRISGGSLRLPNLGATGFALTGDLFVSLQKISGQLETTSLNIPETGTAKYLELGASRWSLNATAGGPFLLTSRPPSLRVMGLDFLPEAQSTLSFTPQAGAVPAQWGIEFNMLRDHKAVPDLLEFKKGRVRLNWLVAPGAPAFTLNLNGGLRLIRLPNQQFAFDQSFNMRLDTVNFDLSLNQMLTDAGLAGLIPVDLFNVAPFRIRWGDLRLRRANAGPVFLEVRNLPFEFNGNPVATVSGSLNSSAELALSGTLGSNGILRLDPSGKLLLRRTGSNGVFQLKVAPLRFALSTPALRLETTETSSNGNYLPSGIAIPELTFDTAGAFDTGKLALPSISFDGITMSKPSGGKKKHNHLRLKRDSAGVVTFTAKSENNFFGATADLSVKLRVSGGSLAASGSAKSNFFILPEPISLDYNSGSACQFRGSAFGHTVFFGRSCAGVRNNATGICVLGSCP